MGPFERPASGGVKAVIAIWFGLSGFTAMLGSLSLFVSLLWSFGTALTMRAILMLNPSFSLQSGQELVDLRGLRLVLEIGGVDRDQASFGQRPALFDRAGRRNV